MQGVEQFAAIGGLGLACFGAIGGTVRWAHREFKEQGRKLDRLEKENLLLLKLYGTVQVRLHRFKLAFDMVAAELHNRDPLNKALAAAKIILNEAFPVDADTPPDMEAMLHDIDGDE